MEVSSIHLVVEVTTLPGQGMTEVIVIRTEVGLHSEEEEASTEVEGVTEVMTQI